MAVDGVMAINFLLDISLIKRSINRLDMQTN